mgnify:CR=1 FL=1
MANKQMIDAMWDDSPVDVGSVKSYAQNCVRL